MSCACMSLPGKSMTFRLSRLVPSSNLSPSGDVWFRLVVERGDGVVNIVDASQAVVTHRASRIYPCYTYRKLIVKLSCA
jgi:hypothetical protein